MEESFAPKDTIDTRALAALAERSDVTGLTRLAGHGATLLATGVLLTTASGTGWLLPAMLAHGVTQLRDAAARADGG